jgi:hypothetical protein
MHNQPIKINENIVKFVKYRGLRRYWTIVVRRFESETEKGYRAEILEVPVTLTVFTTRISETEYGLPIVCTNGFELIVGEYRFTDVYELESTYVTADVPYSKPVCLANLLQRLLRFIDVVSGA